MRSSISLAPRAFFGPFVGNLNRLRVMALVVATAMGPCVLPAHAAPTQLDADFLAAKAAFDKGDRTRFNALLKGAAATASAAGAQPSSVTAGQFAGYVLEPYILYWQLNWQLNSQQSSPPSSQPILQPTTQDDVAPADVRAFLERYPNSPLADKLRVDWLKALARRGDWNRFAVDYPPASSDDVELACYGVMYKRQRDGDAALAAAKPLWFVGQATPDACEPLFAALFARGDLTMADRRARFRLAMEAGQLRLAQTLGNDFPGKNRLPEREFVQVSRDPLAALNKGAFAWQTSAGQDLALVALERAARSDSATARAPWVKIRDHLGKAERDYGNARLSFYAARQLNPSANEWFRESKTTTLGVEERSWQIRAALRAKDWEAVLAGIDALPESARTDASWRYWQARAQVAKGREAEGRVNFAALAGEPTFYGVLSSEALGRTFVPPPADATPVNDAALAAFGARPDVRRAVKLAALELRTECVREWYYIVRGQPDDTLLLAADYARRVGMYDRAINAADRTRERHDYTLRYLAPFRTEFAAAAKAQDIDVALLYGIARQESRFNYNIVSSAGAVGLMQLMPATAKWVAKQMNRTDYRPAQIGDNDINTQFGAYYFKYWLDRLDRMPALAAAAYNAGPGRAQAWRPPISIEGAAWVESIPFNETRDYVKKVLANSVIYGSVLGGQPPSLTDRLGVITPRGTTADPAVAVAQ